MIRRKMYLLMISGFLSFNVVSAEFLNNMEMNYRINDDGQMMKEDVHFHFRENYIKIEAPAIDRKAPATIIVDTSEGVTELRQAGRCFILSDGFDDTLSTNMDDWHEDFAGVDVVTVRTEDIVVHNYSTAPFPIERENIPSVMKDECDEIYPAVLVNSIYGFYAERKLHEADTLLVAKMYGPQKQNINGNRNRNSLNRNKRILPLIALAALLN